MRAEDDRAEAASERDAALAMLRVAMDVVTPEQYAEIRLRLATRDLAEGFPE